MAKKKPTIPSIADLTKGTETAAERWLEAMLKDSVPKEDGDFEVLDTGGPAMQPTTSSNPTRPRTLKAGYDHNEQKLVVVFRDGTWWEYRGVSEELWEGFKNADSKGKFLKSSGLDNWANMGPADVDNMPKHRREQMNDIKEFADYMYRSRKSTDIPTLDDYLFGKR